MTLKITPIGPCIGATAEGIDLREPLSAANAEAIHHAMDRYAVLVFHGQPLTNEQHLAFTQALGTLEDTARNTLRKPEDQRLPQYFADVSNLNGKNQPFAREDRKRLFAIGNRLWHSEIGRAHV